MNQSKGDALEQAFADLIAEDLALFTTADVCSVSLQHPPPRAIAWGGFLRKCDTRHFAE